MSQKIVISGSSSLPQDIIATWINYWSKKGEVINYPRPIDSMDGFVNIYGKMHKDFFTDLQNADILFVLNEAKNGLAGYIGYEVYAEITFAVVQKTVNKKNIQIILLNMPVEQIKCYEEIDCYLKLGWVELFEK
jgi:hypothetical protein